MDLINGMLVITFLSLRFSYLFIIIITIIIICFFISQRSFSFLFLLLMGAGGSVSQSQSQGQRKVAAQGPKGLRTALHSLAQGQELEGGVGRVVKIEKSLTATAKQVEEACGTNYGWFVASVQFPEQWEPYNDESAARLERAFLQQEGSCTVVHNKRGYTVDLSRMEQLPSAGQRPRKVKRAACEAATDPATGAKMRRLVIGNVGDPFDDDEDNMMATAALGFQDCDAGGTYSPAAPEMFPLLKRSTYPLNGAIFNMAMSPAAANGPVVVTGGRRGELRGWNAATSTLTTAYALSSSATVLQVCYQHSGGRLAAGSDDFKARIFREDCPTPLHELSGHTGKVYGLGYTAGDETLVTGSMDSSLRLWDVETGVCKQSAIVQTSHVFGLKCSAGQPSLAVSAGNDALLTVHDFRVPSLVAMRCAGHRATIWYTDIHPSDMQFASCGKDCTVRLWDARNTSDALFVLRNHLRAVHCVAYTPSGAQVLSSGRDGRVVCYSSVNGEGLWQATAHSSGVFRVLYNAQKKKLLTCAVDGCVNIWDWKSDHTIYVASAALSFSLYFYHGFSFPSSVEAFLKRSEISVPLIVFLTFFFYFYLFSRFMCERYVPPHDAIPMSASSEGLVVADMGLDFRSYHTPKKTEVKPLTNLAEFKLQDLVASFEVTAGILFHCLRQCLKAPSPEAKQCWLNIYSKFQLEHLQLKPADEAAKSAVDYITTVDLRVRHADQILQDLCARFDMQFPPKNAETTWDRIRKNAVQAAFCNIHTSGRKCDAKYCNQLHLRNINEETNHRFYFYKGLVELLEADGASPEDICYRLKDAMFFARHGNECTVRYEGRSIAFFDTMFTYGRLNHACRRSTEECRNPACKSEECPGIHIRKRNGQGPKERREMSIQRPNDVLEVLERDATRIMALVKEARAAAAPPLDTLSRSSSTHSSITSTMNRYNAENQIDDEELNLIPLYT
eukprot:gene10473-7278_t